MRMEKYADKMFKSENWLYNNLHDKTWMYGES